MSRLVILAMCGCVGDPEPPFMFSAVDVSIIGQESVLVAESYESYSGARENSAFSVLLSDGSTTETVSLKIGVCADFGCTGPLKEERVLLRLSSYRPGRLHGYTCIGIDGVYDFSGIDSVGQGDCAD